MKYSKKIVLSIIFVAVAVVIAYGVESYQSIYQIKEKIIRLHVLANSNTEEDQELKYKVRNNVIEAFDQEFEFVLTKDESQDIIIEKINEIRDIAEDTVKKEGYPYDVNVYYGNYKFPRKQYEEIILPEGNYDAVRIEIGKAEGNNWWCVMFPPICFVNFGEAENSEPVFDIDTEKKLSEVLTQKEIESIKKSRGLSEIKLKSKIFEIIERGKVENTGVYADGEGKTYAVSTDNISEQNLKLDTIQYKNIPAEIYLMAKTVYAEAKEEPYEGKVAVATVIMNRVKHPDFPNTVADVVYEPGAFTSVDKGQINQTPNEESYRAVYDAINGWDTTNNSLYYWNTSEATTKWIMSRKVETKISNHWFGN